MTPEQAQAKYKANLNEGLLPVLNRLQTAFEAKAELVDLTATPIIDLIVNVKDVQLLREQVILAAAKLFEEYLSAEGWDFVVRPVGSIGISDEVFTFELKEWAPAPPLTEKQAQLAVMTAMMKGK